MGPCSRRSTRRPAATSTSTRSTWTRSARACARRPPSPAEPRRRCSAASTSRSTARPAPLSTSTPAASRSTPPGTPASCRRPPPPSRSSSWSPSRRADSAPWPPPRWPGRSSRSGSTRSRGSTRPGARRRYEYAQPPSHQAGHAVSTTPIQPGEETLAAARPRMTLLLDPMLLLAAIGLVACSVITLESATATKVPGHPLYYVQRQAIFAGVGLLFVLLLSRIDYSRLREFKWGLLAVMIGLNLVVYAMPPILGARRWIPLPFLNFQSSEFGKVLIIVALAAFAVDRSRALHEWRTTARIMLLALIAAMLVIPQPDLGTGLVYVAIGFTVLFFAGTSFKQLGALVTMFVVAIAIVLAGAPAMGVHLLKPYQV